MTTDLLRKAFEEAFGIPKHEQDALAELIFAAIKSEELDRDPEKFRRLLREFRDDARSGCIERDSLELDWPPPLGHRTDDDKPHSLRTALKRGLLAGATRRDSPPAGEARKMMGSRLRRN
jgi:hypothetical protein